MSNLNDTSSASLPAELILIILHESADDQQTLVRLAGVCKLLYDESQAYLYKDVGFIKGSSHPAWDDDLQASFKTAKRQTWIIAPPLSICRNPKLAKHVRRYTVVHGKSVAYPGTHLEPLCTGEALSNMINLRELYLEIHRVPETLFAAGQVPFRLSTLSWSQAPAGLFSRFIRHQTELRRVRLDTWPVDTSDSAACLAALDKMEVFEGPTKALESIWPRPKTTTILCDNRDSLFDRTFSQIAQTFQNLRVLSVSDNTRIEFETLAQNLFCIEYLQCNSKYLLSIQEIPAGRFMIPRLPLKSTLKGIVLTFPVPALSQMLEARFKNAGSLAFEAFPELQFIDFECFIDSERSSVPGRRLKRWFLRYTRTSVQDDAEPTKIPSRNILENIYGYGSPEAEFSLRV